MPAPNSTPADSAAQPFAAARRALVLFAVLLVALLTLGYAAFNELVEREEQRILHTLHNVAEIQSAAVGSWVNERLRDAHVFSSGRFLGEAVHHWVSRGAPDDAVREQVLEQLLAIRASFGYLEVAIVDIHGNPYLTTGATEGPATMLSSPLAMNTVQAAIGTNRPELSSIHSGGGPNSERRVVDIAAPLVDLHARNGKVPSILLLRANAGDQFEPIVKATPLLDTATEVFIAEVIGNQVMAIWSSRNAIHFTSFGQLPLSPEQLQAGAAEARALRMDNVLGSNVAVVRPVRGTPWYLVTLIDSEAARDSVANMAWLVALAAFGVLLISGLALLLWAREKESSYRLRALQAANERRLLQRRYDYLSRYANDMIILTDRAGNMLEVNDKTLQLLGRARDAVLGRHVGMLFLPEYTDVLSGALKELHVNGQARFEVSQRGENGALLCFDASARALEMGGRYIAQFIFRDISERRASESALRQSQERLNGILASIRDVVWSYSPDFTRLHYINQSAERVFGYPPQAFERQPSLWLESLYPNDRAHYLNTVRALTPANPLYDLEIRIVASDGTLRWLHCRGQLVSDALGRPQRIDSVATDITQRKQAEHQVQQLAYYDSVTRLPNRALLRDRLGQALPIAARTQRKVALLFMDLDNFKNINDSLGHEVGDQLLRAIAVRLRECVRAEDTVARIGGDEFLIVLPDLAHASEAVPVAEKVLEAAAAPIALTEHRVHTTISIGISIYPDDARDTQELIRHADSALYQAKGRGRNTYQFFTPELNLRITRSSEIERRLRHALESGALKLWYQPQVDARSGRLIGAEALVRWHIGSREYLSPADFIPVAEERGLINSIGTWALREACLQCKRWQEQGLQPVPVAVNVSPLQFQQKDFADRLQDIIEEVGVDPGLLELEITEGALMRGAAESAELTMRLRRIGVGISIDDFGTGYSSLSYLRQIPIDKIKIDRSFVSDLVEDGAITRAIVQLAHGLNLRVIAEGVESRAQIDRLRAFGCDEMQGHYYSGAVSPEEFSRFLANRYSFATRPASSVH